MVKQLVFLLISIVVIWALKIRLGSEPRESDNNAYKHAKAIIANNKNLTFDLSKDQQKEEKIFKNLTWHSSLLFSVSNTDQEKRPRVPT